MSDEILPYSELAKSFKLGIYRHFKGGEYEIIGVARNSLNANEECVVYRSLNTGYIWLRPIEMFLENVERDGYKGPRFIFVR